LFGAVALLGRAFMLGIPGQQFIIRFLNLKLISAGLECSLNIASYPIPVSITYLVRIRAFPVFDRVLEHDNPARRGQDF